MIENRSYIDIHKMGTQAKGWQMGKFTAQAGWTDSEGEHDDAKDFDTENQAREWLDDYHKGREMREIWQGRKLVCNLA
jgi:hypothetical protein